VCLRHQSLQDTDHVQKNNHASGESQKDMDWILSFFSHLRLASEAGEIVRTSSVPGKIKDIEIMPRGI
jgi:hypothetical protein